MTAELREALTGDTSPGPSDKCDGGDGEAGLQFLHTRVTAEFCNAYSPLLCRLFSPYIPDRDRLIKALCRVGIMVRTDEFASVDSVVGGLVAQEVLRSECGDLGQGEAVAGARHMVFCMAGWVSLLYQPSTANPAARNALYFCLDPQASRTLQLDRQPVAQSSRPLTELLQAFGVLSDLAGMEPGLAQHSLLLPEVTAAGPRLLPSFVDASILGKIGLVEICWVDNISAHLQLSLRSPATLFLFRVPSLVRLQARENSILSGYVA